MADIREAGEQFNLEVCRLTSHGLWGRPDHQAVSEAAEALIACFASAPLEEQRELRSSLSNRATAVMLSYAGYLGQSALKLDSPELVTKGLTALVIVDERPDI